MIRRTSWPLTPRKLAQRVRKSPRRIHWVGTRSPPRGWDLGVRSAGSAVGAREVRGIAWAPPSSPSFPVTAQTAVSCAGFVRHGAPPPPPCAQPLEFRPGRGTDGRRDPRLRPSGAARGKPDAVALLFPRVDHGEPPPALREAWRRGTVAWRRSCPVSHPHCAQESTPLARPTRSC